MLGSVEVACRGYMGAIATALASSLGPAPLKLIKTPPAARLAHTTVTACDSQLSNRLGHRIRSGELSTRDT